MSLAAYRAVWTRSRAKGAAHHALLVFADFADDNGLCWPSAATIAERLQIEERSSRRVIAGLVSAGELIFVRHGYRGVSVYRIACLDAGYVGRQPLTRYIADSRENRWCGMSLAAYRAVWTRSSVESSTGEQAVCLWNELAAELGLVRVQRLTPSRRSALDARLAEAGLEGWNAALNLVRATPFLRGESDSGWKPTFDWLLKETNFAKILENSYETWAQPTNGDERAAGGRISRKRANHDAFFAALATVATRKC